LRSAQYWWDNYKKNVDLKNNKRTGSSKIYSATPQVKSIKATENLPEDLTFQKS
jgi:hypothetical protein